MVGTKDVNLAKRYARSSSSNLSAEERETLVKSCLPPLNDDDAAAEQASKSQRERSSYHNQQKPKPIRTFLRLKLYSLTFFLVHLIFGIYIRLRQAYHIILDRLLALLYYHHRTPELIQKDVKNLSRLPDHLSVILSLGDKEDGGLDRLMEDVAELSAWCASASIPLLSVYQKTGMPIFHPSYHTQHLIHPPRRSETQHALSSLDHLPTTLLLLRFLPEIPTSTPPRPQSIILPIPIYAV
jgi:dehydrodolichyl diphosphate syntase complex subunit NUS1